MQFKNLIYLKDQVRKLLDFLIKNNMKNKNFRKLKNLKKNTLIASI